MICVTEKKPYSETLFAAEFFRAIVHFLTVIPNSALFPMLLVGFRHHLYFLQLDFQLVQAFCY